MIKTLENIRVVDLTTLEEAGSAYSRILQDFGADVILVEPTKANAARKSHEVDFYHGGKKSIALDLETESGREVLYGLLRTADVFVTSYPTLKLKALGVDYPTVESMNSKIIYAHGSVYGEDGPLKDEPGDPTAVYWAMSGQMWATMEIGDLPPIPNKGMPEVNMGKSIDLGIFAALVRRAKTGKGMYVSASVLSEALYDNADTPVEVQFGAEYPKTRKRPRRATLNTYQCSDGWIAVITLSFEKDFGNLMEAMGRPDLRNDPRWNCIEDTMYDKSPEVVAIMDEAFAKLTCEEAVSRIKAYDMACIKIATVEDVMKDPQVIATRLLEEIEGVNGNRVTVPKAPILMGDMEPAKPARAPRLGEHTREILAGIGYSKEKIDALFAEAAVI